MYLGDLLCSVPAFKAIRKTFPEANITLISLPWAAEFAKRFAYIFNSFIKFPGLPGLPEQPVNPKKSLEFFQHLQNEQYDLLLQMQGNGSIVNTVLPLADATAMAGFYMARGFRPNRYFFMRYPNNLSEVERYLKLTHYLGMDCEDKQLDFPLYQSDYREFGLLEAQLGLSKERYVCIHPGAREKLRRWSPLNFITVADEIASKGYKIVLTGTSSEKGLTKAIAHSMRYPALDLAGKTSLGALALTIKNSQLMVCNDTGVSHLAAALSHPTVVISLSKDKKRWKPANSSLHQFVPGETNNALEEVRFRIFNFLSTQSSYPALTLYS